jgi:hypothetical protein
MKWCIVSVLVGSKYKKFAEIFCKSYEVTTPNNERPEIIFVVDNDVDLNLAQYDFVTIEKLDPKVMEGINSSRTYGTGTVRKFDYSLKRFGYQAALDRGYTDICFIDIDMTVRKWDPDIFDACDVPGLWAGRGYPSSGFGTKPVTNPADVSFTPKLAALKKELAYDTDWVNYTMPFEAVMLLKGVPRDTIVKFVECWGYVSDATKKLNLPKNKVTHEIGLAADMCNIPVHYNKELLSIIFKHYIMNHDVLLDIHKEQIVNDKQ